MFEPLRLKSAMAPKALRVLLLAVVLTGCDDTFIDPFENDDRFYTIYGFLDMLETNHAVRVIPVTRRPAVIRDPADPNAYIDATVTSTELASGQTTRWTHNLEQLEDGTWGHIFRASFMVEAGRTYRLDVLRSDGVGASASTSVPIIHEAALFEKASVRFNADSTVVTQMIRIPGVASPWNMQAIYLWGGGLINKRIYVPYDRKGSRTAEGDWEFEFSISDDQAVVRADIQELIDIGRLDPNDRGFLKSMGLQVRILDANWDPPDGLFASELFAQPEALSNVTNGYGYWGSIGLYIEEWSICELSGPLGYNEAQPDC